MEYDDEEREARNWSRVLLQIIPRRGNAEIFEGVLLTPFILSWHPDATIRKKREM